MHVLLTVSPLKDANGVITGASTIARDITAQRLYEERLQQQALTDDLTGVNNRRGFLRLAEQQLALANRSRRAATLCFLDVDNLKQINDFFGHQEGDAALIDTATLLRTTFRGSDVIGRVGGDEFSVLLVEDEGDPTLAVQRFQHAVEAHNSAGHRRFSLGVTMGTQQHDPARPCRIVELLAQADRAMYKEKLRNVKRPVW